MMGMDLSRRMCNNSPRGHGAIGLFSYAPTKGAIDFVFSFRYNSNNHLETKS